MALLTLATSHFLTGNDNDDELSTASSLHDMQLHSNVPEDPPQVFTSGVIASNSQLLATTAALANASERDMPRQGEGVYVGEGLPPVPSKLAKQIRSGEYVEMEELLPEVCTREDGEPEAKQ